MRFAFTDDQLAFADAVRELLADQCDAARVRAAWDGDGRVPGLWDRLAEMGVLGMLAPEGTGGLGMADVDLVAILAEGGRAAIPDPLAATAAVAVPTIRDHAQSDDAERWLAEISAGTARVGVGLSGNVGVLHAADAAIFLLEADDGLHLVDADVVERLLAADAVIVGRTNCDEFAMGSSNENSAYGRVLNPVDKRMVPGGSSGGAAASVAAGAASMAGAAVMSGAANLAGGASAVKAAFEKAQGSATGDAGAGMDMMASVGGAGASGGQESAGAGGSPFAQAAGFGGSSSGGSSRSASAQARCAAAGCGPTD